jgi:RHS repeat-associated protein
MPISRTAGGQTIYYLQDHAGSVTALTSATGTLLGRYHYSPFGTLVSSDAGLPAQPLKWTGRELDETGLYYLPARYYHPGWGRFISEDPAGLEAGLNVYLFALNSPLGMRDPFGLDATNLNDGGSWFDPIKNWYMNGMGGTSDWVDERT